MKGQLSVLSDRVGKQAILFREHKDMKGFYAAGENIPVTEDDCITKVKDGVFENFYPCDKWYENAARALIHIRDEKSIFSSEYNEIRRIFSAYKLSCGASGDILTLDETGKQMIICAVFLEADIIRAVMRNDKNVIIRRGEKLAELYFDYYYDENINKENKGYLSRAASAALKNILLLLGSDLDGNGFYI